MRLALLFAAPVVLLCAAESGSLNGPAPLYVFDSAAKAVKPMIGVPGSSYLSGAVAADVDSAATSPDGAAVAYLKGGSLFLLRNGSATMLAENSSGPLAWSADSSVVVADGLLWQGGAVTRLASSGAKINAIAAGKNHAVAAADGGIWLLTAESARKIAIADQASSVDINGADLYYTDAARGEVWLLRDYVAGGDPVLVTKLEGASAVDAEGALILVSAGRKVLGLRASSFDAIFALELDFDASSLARLNRSTWLLNAGQTGPLQVLSLDGDPAVYFVPRGEEAN